MASPEVTRQRRVFELRENRDPKAIVALAPIKTRRQCAMGRGGHRVRPLDIESGFGRLIRVCKIPKR